MNPVKTLSGAVTRPAHLAVSVAGRAVGLSVGVTRAGFRTTGRLVEWAADRGLPAPPAAPTATPTTEVRPMPTPTAAPTEEPKPKPKPKAKAKATPSSVPTPADVKPAIDRSAPLEAESSEPVGPVDRVDGAEPVEDEVLTASGIPAAGVGVNPATGQPNRYDTEPESLLDPSTVKAVRSETDVLRRAADENKG